MREQNFEFHAFIDEVEPEYREEYWKEIAYPTCLKQIKDRIDTKYYRCKEALEWEVDLIHKNCSAFNGNTDEQSNGLFRKVFHTMFHMLWTIIYGLHKRHDVLYKKYDIMKNCKKCFSKNIWSFDPCYSIFKYDLSTFWEKDPRSEFYPRIR